MDKRIISYLPEKLTTMKLFYLCLLPLLAILPGSTMETAKKTIKENHKPIPMEQDSVLRHVVLFKFKEESSPEDIAKVEEAFTALPSKIPEIHAYEWGLNNSPEGLDKGFTHCFFLSFKSEEDRAIYLPHPDHKAFGDLLSPHLEDVLVVDYWTK